MNTNSTVAQILIQDQVCKTFDYNLPDDSGDSKNLIGKRAIVPFGRRKLSGLIVDIGRTDEKERQLKHIIEIVDEEPLLNSELLNFLKEISRYYMLDLGVVIAEAIPPQAKHRTRKLIRLSAFGRSTAVIDPIEREVIDFLASRRPLTTKWLLKQLPGAKSVIKDLVSRGIVEEFSHTAKTSANRPPEKPDAAEIVDIAATARETIPNLTDAQEEVLSATLPFIGKQSYDTFLLHGVTGSGKTEIYLRLTEAAMRKNLGVIVLVPEIALTPQLVDRMRRRFNRQISVLHSHLGVAERLSEWRSLAAGRRNLVIGARSAIFAPVRNLGLIILDEEHDHSYKQDERVPYHGRQLAKIRARQNNAVVLYGSATPDVETFYESRLGKTSLLTMPSRIAGMHQPEVHVVDMRKEPKQYGKPSFLSKQLIENLKDTVAKKEAAILFLNRRGYTPTLLCALCGETPECQNCSVNLTFHQKREALLCHYCGYSEPRPLLCKHCGGEAIIDVGMGTEKLEKELNFLFPDCRISRMDRDTTRTREAHSKIIHSLEAGNTDILVGTQMVTKGLDIGRVTLVGVISADLGLNLPDFRASERTFQLVTQVAGRAGRGKNPGRVIIQTYKPQHYTFKFACGENYLGFYDKEIAIRQAANYPPFAKLVGLRFTSTDDAKLRTSLRSKEVKLALQQIASTTRAALMGPTVAPIHRLYGKYRWHAILKLPADSHSHQIKAIWPNLTALAELLNKHGVKLRWDVDPVSFL